MSESASLLSCPGFLPPSSTPRVRSSATPPPAAHNHPQLPGKSKPLAGCLPTHVSPGLLSTASCHTLLYQPTKQNFLSIWHLTTAGAQPKSNLFNLSPKPLLFLPLWTVSRPLGSTPEAYLSPTYWGILGLVSPPQKPLPPSFFRPGRSLSRDRDRAHQSTVHTTARRISPDTALRLEKTSRFSDSRLKPLLALTTVPETGRPVLPPQSCSRCPRCSDHPSFRLFLPQALDDGGPHQQPHPFPTTAGHAGHLSLLFPKYLPRNNLKSTVIQYTLWI